MGGWTSRWLGGHVGRRKAGWVAGKMTRLVMADPELSERKRCSQRNAAWHSHVHSLWVHLTTVKSLWDVRRRGAPAEPPVSPQDTGQDNLENRNISTKVAPSSPT